MIFFFFDFSDDVVIGNTDQLCNCIVGMLSEINIELVNNGNRWIKYHIELIEVRGDKQSIELITTQEECLLKPNGTQSTKVHFINGKINSLLLIYLII